MSLQLHESTSTTLRHPIVSPIPNVTHSIRYDSEGLPAGSRWELEEDFRPEESPQTMNLRITIVVEKNGTWKVRIASVGLSHFGLRHESLASEVQRLLSVWQTESHPIALESSRI